MLSDHQPKTSGARLCRYGAMRAAMPDSERSVLDSWEADPAWSAKDIYIALNQESYPIGIQLVRDHLAEPKRCLCVT